MTALPPNAHNQAAARPGGEAPLREAFWNTTSFRAYLYQALVMGGVIAIVGYLVGNAMDALDRLGVETGFDYLSLEAGFGIGESMFEYQEQDSYLYAYFVGIANTLKVGFLGIILATILGTFIGIARLSTNWLVAKLASVYVETFRNTPQLLQIIFWYVAMVNMPLPRMAWKPMEGVFISNRGLLFGAPVFGVVHAWMGVAFLAGCVGAYLMLRYARTKQAQTGLRPNILWPNLGLIFGLPVLVWFIGGMPSEMNVPKMGGFNFRGGYALSPEFLAVLLGLSLYIAAFIAEIVRSGIQSVAHGQVEAARSLGLKQGLTYRLVVLPQALRVMVPPATAQYVSLVKNSSLAVAVGYPDVVHVANTTINQTGHTVEGIAMIMLVYLTISLLVAAYMNWYNQSVMIKER
jgi:general L-amino acid transport system permease protein